MYPCWDEKIEKLLSVCFKVLVLALGLNDFSHNEDTVQWSLVYAFILVLKDESGVIWTVNSF